jgi:uncharacterized protein DUF6882
MFAKRSHDGAELSPEADTFLAAAIMEFNAKQQALTKTWRFAAFEQWAYDPDTGVLNLEFADKATLVADGQLLGTFSVADNTFEWAWSRPHFGATITKESARVKELGRRLGISYLQAGIIPIPDEAFMSYVCAIGLKASDSAGMFRGDGDVQPMIMVKNLRWA